MQLSKLKTLPNLEVTVKTPINTAKAVDTPTPAKEISGRKARNKSMLKYHKKKQHKILHKRVFGFLKNPKKPAKKTQKKFPENPPLWITAHGRFCDNKVTDDLEHYLIWEKIKKQKSDDIQSENLLNMEENKLIEGDKDDQPPSPVNYENLKEQYKKNIIPKEKFIKQIMDSNMVQTFTQDQELKNEDMAVFYKFQEIQRIMKNKTKKKEIKELMKKNLTETKDELSRSLISTNRMADRKPVPAKWDKKIMKKMRKFVLNPRPIRKTESLIVQAMKEERIILIKFPDFFKKILVKEEYIAERQAWEETKSELVISLQPSETNWDFADQKITISTLWLNSRNKRNNEKVKQFLQNVESTFLDKKNRVVSFKFGGAQEAKEFHNLMVHTNKEKYNLKYPWEIIIVNYFILLHHPPNWMTAKYVKQIFSGIKVPISDITRTTKETDQGDTSVIRVEFTQAAPPDDISTKYRIEISNSTGHVVLGIEHPKHGECPCMDCNRPTHSTGSEECTKARIVQRYVIYNTTIQIPELNNYDSDQESDEEEFLEEEKKLQEINKQENENQESKIFNSKISKHWTQNKFYYSEDEESAVEGDSDVESDEEEIETEKPKEEEINKKDDSINTTFDEELMQDEELTPNLDEPFVFTPIVGPPITEMEINQEKKDDNTAKEKLLNDPLNSSSKKLDENSTKESPLINDPLNPSKTSLEKADENTAKELSSLNDPLKLLKTPPKETTEKKRNRRIDFTGYQTRSRSKTPPKTSKVNQGKNSTVPSNNNTEKNNDNTLVEDNNNNTTRNNDNTERNHNKKTDTLLSNNYDTSESEEESKFDTITQVNYHSSKEYEDLKRSVAEKFKKHPTSSDNTKKKPKDYEDNDKNLFEESYKLITSEKSKTKITWEERDVDDDILNIQEQNITHDLKIVIPWERIKGKKDFLNVLKEFKRSTNFGIKKWEEYLDLQMIATHPNGWCLFFSIYGAINDKDYYGLLPPPEELHEINKFKNELILEIKEKLSQDKNNNQSEIENLTPLLDHWTEKSVQEKLDKEFWGRQEILPWVAQVLNRKIVVLQEFEKEKITCTATTIHFPGAEKQRHLPPHDTIAHYYIREQKILQTILLGHENGNHYFSLRSKINTTKEDKIIPQNIVTPETPYGPKSPHENTIIPENMISKEQTNKEKEIKIENEMSKQENQTTNEKQCETTNLENSKVQPKVLKPNQITPNQPLIDDFFTPSPKNQLPKDNNLLINNKEWKTTDPMMLYGPATIKQKQLSPAQAKIISEGRILFHENLKMLKSTIFATNPQSNFKKNAAITQWGAQKPLLLRQLMLQVESPLLLLKYKHQQLNLWADQLAYKAQQQKLVLMVRNTKNPELKKKIRLAIASSAETGDSNPKERMASNPELWSQLAEQEKVIKESQPSNCPDKEWKALILMGEAVPRNIIKLLLQEIEWPSSKMSKLDSHLRELDQVQIFLLPSIMLAIFKNHAAFREAMRNVIENQDFSSMDKLLGEKQKKISKSTKSPHT